MTALGDVIWYNMFKNSRIYNELSMYLENRYTYELKRGFTTIIYKHSNIMPFFGKNRKKLLV